MASSSTADLLSAGRAQDARLGLMHFDVESLNPFEQAAHAVNESAVLPQQEAQQTMSILEQHLMVLENGTVPIGVDRLNAASVSLSLAYQICRIGTPEKAVEVSARAVLLVRSWFSYQGSPSNLDEESSGMDWPMRDFEDLWNIFATFKDASGAAACSATRALGRAAALSLSQCHRILEARSLVELHKRCCLGDGQGGVEELTLLDAAMCSASGNTERAQAVLVGATRPDCAEMLSHLSFIASTSDTPDGVQCDCSDEFIGTIRT